MRRHLACDVDLPPHLPTHPPTRVPACMPALPASKQYTHQHSGAVSAGVAASQWLSLRLQIIAAVLVFLVALLAVLDTENVLPSPSHHRYVNVGELPCQTKSCFTQSIYIRFRARTRTCIAIRALTLQPWIPLQAPIVPDIWSAQSWSRFLWRMRFPFHRC